MTNIGPDSQAARIGVSDMMPSSAGQASRLLSVTAAASSTAAASPQYRANLAHGASRRPGEADLVRQTAACPAAQGR